MINEWHTMVNEVGDNILEGGMTVTESEFYSMNKQTRTAAGRIRNAIKCVLQNTPLCLWCFECVCLCFFLAARCGGFGRWVGGPFVAVRETERMRDPLKALEETIEGVDDRVILNGVSDKMVSIPGVCVFVS